MKLKEIIKKNDKLTHLLNFPVFIFIMIILVAFVSFWGRKITTSQESVSDSSINCSKTGVNPGNFPGDTNQANEVFGKMQDIGLSWYQGLIEGPGDEQKVADAINTAKNYDINIILRICWGSKSEPSVWEEDTWHCGFIDEHASKYVNSLKQISDLTGGAEFWAIAGHNEPNALEKIDVNKERDFMEGVIDGVKDYSNIHLLSPIMDLHARSAGAVEFKIYLNNLNKNGRLSELYGIAGNTYEFPTSDDTLEARIKAFQKDFGDYDLYITETGIREGASFDSFKSNYRWALQQDRVKAILFYKPQGLLGDGEGLTVEEINTIIPECGSDPRESLINECAFEDYPLEPCEEGGNPGHLGMGRGLVLEYERHAEETWSAEWIATAQIENLPAFSYFASNSYKGDENADYPSQSVNLNRLSTGCVYNSLSNETICYDSTIQVEGYGLITTGEGGILARPEYHEGSGILTSVMGDYSDYTAPLRIPRQFIIEQDEVEFPETSISTEIETEEGSEGNFLTNLLEGLKNFLKNLFGFGDRLTEKHCIGHDFEIDGLWEENSTSGQETVIGEGNYDYDLESFIQHSALANTLKGGHCDSEGDTCKILPMALESCNPCTDFYEQVPDEPGNPNTTYHDGDFLYSECDRIDWETGEILDRAGLINCINGHSLLVRHHIPPRGFELGGAAYILETYWKKLQMLTTDRRICHNKNIGIEVDVQGYLYDKIDDCGGGGGGSSSCGGTNLVKNSDFSWGTRKPPQTEKQQWGATPVYWFPWWNPSPPGDADNILSTEINVIADGISDDRGSDGHYAHIFTPEYAQRMDAGIFQEIWFGDENGNTITIPAGATINITARGQGNNSYVGESNADYIVNSEFQLSYGVKYGGAIDSLAASGPSEENFQFSSFNSLQHINSGSQNHDGSGPPGFIDLEGNYTLTQSTDKISIFLQGVDTNGSSTSSNKLQSFWDNMCVSLPEYPEVVNISPEEQAEAYPWEGDDDSGYCEPDSPFTMGCSFDHSIHTAAHPELKAYFPYFGSLIFDYSYLDIQQQAISPDTTDLPLCENADDDTIICFCEPGDIDPLAEYLIRVGILDKTEAKLAGIDDEEYQNIENEGDVGPSDEEENDDSDGDEDSGFVPDIDSGLWEVLKYVSDSVKEQTGHCIPAAMIASIMSIETNTNYTKSQINTKIPDPSSNSEWCSRINEACTGRNTSAEASDEVISSELSQITSHVNCSKPIPESASQECKDVRTVVDDLTMGCCDVRGPMQFDVNTWLGYKDQVEPISLDVLEHFGFDTSNYNEADRVRLIDAIVAAALKLRAGCSDWESNEEYTVRYKAGCYVGGCNTQSSYANSAWARYKEFKGIDWNENDWDDSDIDGGVNGQCTGTNMPLNLPFDESINNMIMIQGWYNSSSTHARIPANDFSDGVGQWKVIASRGGVIAEIKEDSAIGGGSVDCDKSNYVSVYHPDYGLYTHYVHLTYNSVPDYLYVGKEIERGQLLGISGSTGCSSGDHLHFNVSTTPYWNSNYSPKYCFVEYPDTNWRETQYLMVKSQNKLIENE